MQEWKYLILQSYHKIQGVVPKIEVRHVRYTHQHLVHNKLSHTMICLLKIQLKV